MKKWNLLLLLFLISCTGDLEIPIDPETGSKEEKTITLCLQTPGLSRPKTYGATAEDENRVVEIDVLAFAKNGSVDTLSYWTKVDKDQIVDALDASKGNKKTVSFVLKRQTTPVRLVVIANARAQITSATLATGQSMSDILEKLKFDQPAKWLLSPSKSIPMWGQSDGYFTVKDPVAETSKPITLLRAVAKVDVGIDLYGDPSIGFGKRFELQHVYVYKARSKGYIAPDMSDPNFLDPNLKNRVSKPNIPSDAGYMESVEYTVSDNRLSGEIYLPEDNVPTSGSESNAPCLIIGGSYDGGTETFYKVGFTKNDGTYLPLLRNHRYLVNITNISKKGYASKDQAFGAKSFNMVSSLQVTDENIKGVTYDDQNVLGVGTDVLTVDWDDVTAKSIRVITDVSGGWKASIEAKDDWITDLKPNGTTAEDLTFKVKLNTTTPVRKGIITVTAGTLSYDIEVKQYLGANSYIVKPGQIIKIPLVHANSDGNTRLNPSSVSVDMIWRDTKTGAGTSSPGSLNLRGSGVGRYIEYKAPTVGEGNALIVVKSSSSPYPILWSWHAWVTNYDSEELSGQKAYNGMVFMDRNLGAIKNNESDPLSAAGLIYQWGRKDPFPGGTSLTPGEKSIKPLYPKGTTTALPANKYPNVVYEKVAANSNLENTIKNPTTFYYNPDSPYYDWYGLTEQNNNLWDNNGKTIFDPCPVGWRVPVSTSANFSVWQGLQPSTWSTGYNWSDGGYYPAAGGYDYYDGQLTDVGIRGYVWSASVAGSQAFNFNVGKDLVKPASSSYRANGYSVRCVKEK